MINDSFTDFSEVLNIATMFGRTRSELSKFVKTAPKMIDLQLVRLPGHVYVIWHNFIILCTTS